MISDKKIKLLELAGRMEIGYARDYAILTNARELTAIRKRLAELCRDGYMTETWRNGRKAYYASQKGLSQIETHMTKPYNPAGYTTDHALYISEVASYLHVKAKVSADSIIFDREMENMEQLKPIRQFSGHNNKKRNQRSHAPDIICGNRCCEIEITAKAKSRLKENYSINATIFEKQIWIVPRRLKSLQKSLRALETEFNCPTTIITIEGIEKFLKEYDLSQNEEGRRIDLRLKNPKPKKDIMERLT